jgi:hypothetical protein
MTRVDFYGNTPRKIIANMRNFYVRIEDLPEVELPIDFRYMESTPVLFGHYWLDGEPTITFSNAACLDFSVARKGYLTAYRWSGERMLSNEHLVHVPSENLIAVPG